MSVITWDGVGDRLYETGTKNGVLYVQNSGGGYAAGVAWNGLTGVSQSPEGGEATSIYADDIKYLTLRSVEDFKGTITAYTYPKEFAACDGSANVALGAYVGQQTRRPFGMSYVTTIGNDTEFEDHGYKIHLVWGASISPSQKDYKTINDSLEAIEFSWEFETIPTEVPGYKKAAHMEIDSTDFVTTEQQAKLQDLKDMLYGTANSDPTLPTPAQVIALLGSAEVVTYVYTLVSSPTGNPSTSGYYVRSGNDWVASTDTTVVDGTSYYTREAST